MSNEFTQNLNLEGTQQWNQNTLTRIVKLIVAVL